MNDNRPALVLAWATDGARKKPMLARNSRKKPNGDARVRRVADRGQPTRKAGRVKFDPMMSIPLACSVVYVVAALLG